MRERMCMCALVRLLMLLFVRANKENLNFEMLEMVIMESVDSICIYTTGIMQKLRRQKPLCRMLIRLVYDVVYVHAEASEYQCGPYSHLRTHTMKRFVMSLYFEKFDIPNFSASLHSSVWKS